MTKSEEHDQQEEPSLESFETEENQNVTIDSFDVKDESGGLESDPAQNLGNVNSKEMENINQNSMENINQNSMENMNQNSMGDMEFNEAGNVMLCCFAAFLIQLYYFDI